MSSTPQIEKEYRKNILLKENRSFEMAEIVKKNWLVIAIVGLMGLTAGLSYWILPAKAEPIDQYHSSWHVVRADATEDASTFLGALPLQTSEGDFANKPTGAFRIPSRSGGISGRGEGYSPGTKWMFAFCGDHEDGDTFSFDLVGWAKTNGMAQVICEGNGVLGKQDVVIQPDGTADANGFWADTLAVDDTKLWPGLYNDANDGVIVRNGAGGDQVAILIIETTGLEWIQFFIYDAAGTAECASVAVYGRRY